MEAIHEGIFFSAEEAITFACNYSSQQYAMSPMAKLLQGPGRGSGRGLTGLDGAGQSGMVFRELEGLDYWQMLALVARKAPRSESCNCLNPCCRGWRMTELFREAVSQLADQVAREARDVLPVKAFRVAVLRKHFGDKIHVLDEAEKLGIDEHPANRHATTIRKWIRELEKKGLTSLSERLDQVGMLVRTT